MQRFHPPSLVETEVYASASRLHNVSAMTVKVKEILNKGILTQWVPQITLLEMHYWIPKEFQDR